MGTNLLIGTGLFWVLTYILLIKQGFEDKTYGMPLVALCGNISWEFIFSFLHPHEPPQLQANIAWFILDLIILLQFLKFGQSEFKYFPEKLFYPMFLLCLIISFCGVLFVTYEFHDWTGAYTAFGQNLMMSILFIGILVKRNSLRGQSIFIALSKMIGTLLASVGFYLSTPTQGRSLLFIFLYSTIFIFDLIYVAMIAIKMKDFRQEQLDVMTM